MINKSVSFKHPSETDLDILISYPLFQQEENVENLVKLITTYLRTHGYRKVSEL